jgi:hypothetical protein
MLSIVFGLITLSLGFWGMVKCAWVRYVENRKDAFKETLDYGIVSMDAWQDNTSGAETVEA